MNLKMAKKTIIRSSIYIISIIIITIIALATLHSDFMPKEYYSGSDFDIKTVYSTIDFNHNNVDDYSDFVLGARHDAKNHPRYVSKYYEDSYPPDDEGVCTDVIWRAFKNAGYSLRDMLDEDVKRDPNSYQYITVRDKNIDFRRVGNLQEFFKKYAISLTLDYTDIASWQPGDIVIFNGNKHIGMVSDRRNADGVTYIIHNGGQLNREEDYLPTAKISGHYRFDASKIPEEVLIKWSDK